MQNANSDARQTAAGVFYALLAYLSWGLMPIYWKAVGYVPPVQMIAHRVVWSVLVLVLIISVFRRWQALWATLRNPRHLALLLVTALLVSANWLVFVWSVQHDRVLESSLGYYINPLVNVVLSMVFLHERLRRWQWAAVTLALLGVLNMVVQLGMLPWVSLALAGTFSIYGLLRKIAPVDGLIGLTVETLLLLPLALGYLLLVSVQGEGAFLAGNGRLDMLIMLSGWVTALPLLWFANSARRLRYTTVGFFQYLAPTCQFLLAVLAYNEPFTSVHLITFVCIWLALLLYSVDSALVLHRRARTNFATGTGSQK